MKKLICLAAALLAVTFAYGQRFMENVTLSLDKGPEGIYAKGEKIRVIAETAEETPALVKVYINGHYRRQREITVPAGRSTVFSGSFDEATALMVRLADPADPKDSTTIGAVVAPEEFRPGFEEPADFRKFWKKQLRAMRKEKMHPVLTPVGVSGEDGEKFECYSVEINCIGNAPVRGFIALPRNAEPRSLPIALFLHSAGVMTAPWVHATPERALDLAKRGNGAIGIDINAHGMPEGRETAFYEALQEELKGYAQQQVTDHESFYFRTMYLRAVRVLDYACSRKEWDRKRVLVTGGSQGGAQSAAVAGIDKRVTMAVVDVPGMWDVGGILKGRLSAWGRYLERDGVDSPAATIIPYYDGSNFLRHYKGGLVVNVGLIDMTCPPAAVWSAFNMCASDNKVIHSCAWKGHSGKYSLPKKDFQRVKRSMDRFQKDAIDEHLQ